MRFRVGRALGAAAMVVLAAGCSMPVGPAAGVNGVAARDLAMSVGDPTTGTMQEVTDIGAAFYEAVGPGLGSWSLHGASGFALYLQEGLLSGQLAWNAANHDYEASFSRSITAGSFTGSASGSLSIGFLTSTDGTGTGIQVAPLTSGAAAISSIHSIAYARRLNADFTNTVTHVERKSDSSSSFLATALTIGGSSPGFTLNGSKTVAFTHVYADGTTVVGSLSQAISTSNPIVVTAVLQPDGTYLVTATGQILVSYDATITRADGTTTTVSKNATVTLDGSRTVHVDMDGTDVDVDSTTGETE